MELLETIAAHKSDADEVEVHLLTAADEYGTESQEEYFAQIEQNIAPTGIRFTWEFGDKQALHARHIVADTGWKISLDRGLDIYQRFEMNDAFAVANRMQQYRAVKAFEVTYLRVEE
jgi:ATP-dependent Lon protease